MLLDDVMSELDRNRRSSLIALLLASGGQSVITATDLEQIPGADEAGIARLTVADGQVHGETMATA
jgi:recombinational DNA repair ATPase RecF